MQNQKGDMLIVAIYFDKNVSLIKNKVKTSVFYDKGIRKKCAIK